MNHPFHLHGYAFYVMDMGQYAEGQTAQDLLNFLERNVTNMSPAPAVKDTIAVPSGGYAVIKFRANNPGKLSISLIGRVSSEAFHCLCDVSGVFHH